MSRPPRDQLRDALRDSTSGATPGLEARIQERLRAGGKPDPSVPGRLALPAAALAVLLVVVLIASGRIGRPQPAPVPGAGAVPSAGGSAEPAPTAVPSQTPAPGSSATAPSAFACGRLPATGGGTTISQISAVRLAAQVGYDRFVIEFAGAVPQFEVRPHPSTTFTQDASGRPATLRGTTGLTVVVRNSGSAPRLDQVLDGGEIRQAALLGDFEGVVTYGLGLASPPCVRVQLLSAPDRLVLDLAAA